ncbi:MAG: sigma-70 family RNA polymerase sigma factor [Cyanobacteria bacterium J06592_8]
MEIVDYEEQDERLKAWAIEAQTHPRGSQERQRAITQLVQEIFNSRRLSRPCRGQFTESYDEIYGVAVQKLMFHVCQRIESYKPESAPVMRWVNFLLEREFFPKAVAEVMGNKKVQPEVFFYEDTQTPLPPESSPCLSELVRQVIEEDAEGIFTAKCIRGHSQANFRAIFKRRIMERQSWEQISTELGIKVSTLSDFYQRSLRQLASEIKRNIQS